VRQYNIQSVTLVTITATSNNKSNTYFYLFIIYEMNHMMTKDRPSDRPEHDCVGVTDMIYRDDDD
jgi:hypothetical protein